MDLRSEKNSITKRSILKTFERKVIWPIRSIISARPRVLVYHSGSQRSYDVFKITLSPQVLEEHISYLAHHYNVVPLGQIVSYHLKQLPLPPNSMAITFDDGYLDNYTQVLPLLEKYSVPATFFVILSNILNREPFWWDILDCYARRLSSDPSLPHYLYLNCLDYRQCYQHLLLNLHDKLIHLSDSAKKNYLSLLAASLGSINELNMSEFTPLDISALTALSRSPLVDIGLHTMTHPLLSECTYEQLLYEIRSPKVLLESILCKPVHFFAYPYGYPGSLGEFSSKIVMESGYSAAFTTTWSPVDASFSNYLLPRLLVHSWSLKRLKRVLSTVA